MEIHVIVATKGRAAEVGQLLNRLSQQTLAPTSVIVVGTSDADVAGVAEHPLSTTVPLEVVLSRTAGLCAQRNAGVSHLLAPRRDHRAKDPFAVVFFDDDFRPATDWLEQCREQFLIAPDVVALTGRVLADGIRGAALTEADAADYLAGHRKPQPHFAAGSQSREMTSMYGCNMAFRDCVVHRCRFDESLALYGWQEDQDFTSQAKAFGRTIFHPACRGVHLGSKSGRVSGVRFGYSQIANPLYLIRKGTMSASKATKFVLKHLVSNSTKSLRPHPYVDYAGRLRGNLLAIRDTLRGRCRPERVLEM